MPRSGLPHALLLAGLLLLHGCAGLPGRASAPAPNAWVQAMAMQCEALPADDALAAAVGPQQLDFAREVAAVGTAITGRPLVGGNTLELLIDGPATHTAQLAAIAAAQHHVHLEIYILTDDLVGRSYRDVLIERAQAGVTVRLIYDGLGSFGAGYPYLNELRRAGVQIHEYNAINPLKNPQLWRLNRRDHRKILVVDGRVAFTGGINITDEYANASAPAEPGSEPGWRDTHVRLTGPAVADFQRLFLSTWQKAKGGIEPDARYWPPLPAQGDNLVRVVTNSGADFLQVLTDRGEALVRELRGRRAKRPHGIYETYLAAIEAADARVWISQSYFAPNKAFVKALKRAAARGVDVRLLLPGKSDVPLLLHASRRYYAELLEAGIGLYEFEDAMMHAKTAVIDGVWSTVGSSNLDFRSFVHNDEANAVVIGRDFGTQMEAMFEADLASAHAIDPAQWDRRGFGAKFMQWGAALFKYWI